MDCNAVPSVAVTYAWLSWLPPIRPTRFFVKLFDGWLRFCLC